MDCSLTGASIHGIIQERILEWIAIPFSKVIISKEQKKKIDLFLQKNQQDWWLIE